MSGMIVAEQSRSRGERKKKKKGHHHNLQQQRRTKKEKKSQMNAAVACMPASRKIEKEKITPGVPMYVRTLPSSPGFEPQAKTTPFLTQTKPTPAPGKHSNKKERREKAKGKLVSVSLISSQ